MLSLVLNKICRKKMENIPDDVDILITHVPPYGILDENSGSEEVLNALCNKNMKVHIFGHAHGGYGGCIMKDGKSDKEVICLNVAQWFSMQPVVFDYWLDE